MARKLWFMAKRYGWGWTPCSWEGWLVTLLAVIVIVLTMLHVDRYAHSVSDMLIGSVLPVLGVVMILTGIAYKTGEKPRWRWGGK